MLDLEAVVGDLPPSPALGVAVPLAADHESEKRRKMSMVSERAVSVYPANGATVRMRRPKAVTQCQSMPPKTRIYRR